MTRLVIGNLDAESEWAEGGDTANRPSVEAASGAATLLRVFARDEDVLWTPAPIDERRVPHVDDLARPQFVSGPLPAAPKGRLAWAETASLPRWVEPSVGGDHWIDRLWSIPPSSPVVARAANDRAFDLEVATRLGVPVPGSRMTSSLGETLDAIGDVDGPWIAKSTWSAAGRHRVRGETGAIDDPAVLATLTALLDRGPLRIEAWMARDLDVGAVGLVNPNGGVELVGAHTMLVDGRGRFRGAGTETEIPGEVRRAFEAAGTALHRGSYRGPFGVDGFRTRDGRWFPLGEINARLSFGFVIHALAHRIGAAGVRLTFSKSAPPVHAISVLTPGPGSPIGAWIEPGAQI